MSKSIETSTSGSNIISALIFVVELVCAYVIWSLASENRLLERQLAQMRATSPVRMIAVGDTLPDTPLLGLDGTRDSLGSLLSAGGVVAFLTTTCPYCEATLPQWGRLAAASAGAGSAFVGVSLHALEQTRAYAAAHRIGWPLRVIAPDAEGQAPPVAAVPLTLVLDAGGTVRWLWRGPLDEEALQEAVRALPPAGARAELSSGSPVTDPRCCAAPALGAGAGR